MKTKTLILLASLIFIPLLSWGEDGAVGIGGTAEGTNALGSQTTGQNNTAMGNSALALLQTGVRNTAFGNGALSTTNANDNTAIGSSTMNIATGSFNTVVGSNAGLAITTGGGNTGIGVSALFANLVGNNNTALGANAGLLITGDSNIDIGANQQGTAGESNTTRIGVEGTQTAAFIAGINGAALTNPLPVVIDVNGQLGVGTPVTGFPQGSILLMQQGFPAPTGFVKIGTFKFKYVDNSSAGVTITLDVFQKS